MGPPDRPKTSFSYALEGGPSPPHHVDYVVTPAQPRPGFAACDSLGAPELVAKVLLAGFAPGRPRGTASSALLDYLYGRVRSPPVGTPPQQKNFNMHTHRGESTSHPNPASLSPEWPAWARAGPAPPGNVPLTRLLISHIAGRATRRDPAARRDSGLAISPSWPCPSDPPKISSERSG